jgi:hypothetical protein
MQSQIISLSPSDLTKENFNKDISTLFSDFGENNRIVINEPNSNSVVLLLKLGYHRAILGADLEVVDNPKLGWLDILDNHENIFDKKASMLKISHHGSQNGYHERIWIELLVENSLAKLTPYNKGYKLPQTDMLRKYSDHTNNLYTTAKLPDRDTPKKRDNQTEKIIRFANSTVREIKYNLGIIRSRIDLNQEQQLWDTKVFGSANKIIEPPAS